jgi:hypothetical protein
MSLEEREKVYGIVEIYFEILDSFWYHNALRIGH